MTPAKSYALCSEEAFSTFKVQVRKLLAEKHNQIIATHSLPWGQRGAAKQQIVLQVVTAALTILTTAKINAWCQHVFTFFIACTEMRDI